MIRAARALALLTLALAAGCAPARPLMVPFGEDSTYGFVDKPAPGADYEVTYYGPMIYTQLTSRRFLSEIAQTAEQTSHDLALWRAAELAQEKGFKAFKLREASGVVRHYIVGRDYENVPVGVFEDVIAKRWEYASWTYFRGEARLTIEPTDENGGGVYLAAETAAAMKSRYEAAVGRAIMADTYYYFGPDAWLQWYDEKHIEAPLFEMTPEAKPGPPGKPLGQPYYIP